MNSPLHRALALLVAGLVLGSPVLARKDKPVRPYRVHAVAPSGELLPHDRKTLYEKEGLRVGVQLLDDRARRVFFRERLGIDTDPFYRGFGEPDRMVSFRVVVAASGDKPVHFQPQHVRLVTNKKQSIYPLDLTRLYEQLQKREIEADTELLRTFDRVIFDAAEMIPPGGSVEKLLVFREPRPDSDEWVLDIPFVQVAEKTHSFQVAYAREYLHDR